MSKIVSALNKGDKVTIYNDPITKQVPEGQAILKRRVRSYEGDGERWMVRFPGDHFNVERFICPPFEVF